MPLTTRFISPGAPIKGQTPSYQWFLANSSPSTPELAELFRQARACDVEIYIIEKAHALKTKAIEKVVLDFQEKVREYGLKALEEAKGHTLRLNQQVAARQSAIQGSLANYLSLQATQTPGQISGQQSAYLQLLRALQVLPPSLIPILFLRLGFRSPHTFRSPVISICLLVWVCMTLIRLSVI